MQRLGIPRVATKVILPYILLFALYVQFHGDYGPGGGFQAGVIFGAGFVLYTLIFGIDPERPVISSRLLELLMALGVLLYIGVGVAGMVEGSRFLDYSRLLEDDHPVHGQHLGILLIELGVGITVAATMISIFFAFVRRGRS